MTNKPLRVFIGYDVRQPIAYNVAAHSVVSSASAPVSVTPLILAQLPVNIRGLTDFTYSRFIVPWLCDYEGIALFMDADQVVLGDMAELFAYFDEHSGKDFDIAVMRDQPAFEWPSVMMFNCASEACKKLTPEFINDRESRPLSLNWADKVADLPEKWNVCVGYSELTDEAVDGAELLHYTMGIPIWPETNVGQEAEIWHAARQRMMGSVPWEDLMGDSVHRMATLTRMLGIKYGIHLKAPPEKPDARERKLIVPGN